MAADVTGLIRALGERDATLVGSGYGGVVAWTTAALHPRSSPPARRDRRRAPAAAAGGGGQPPARPALGGRADGEVPTAALRARADPQRRGPGRRVPAPVVGPRLAGDTRLRRVRAGVPQRVPDPPSRPSAPESRWGVRSLLRLHGHRFRRQLRAPIVAPTLHLHGALDPVVLPSTALGSGRYVIAAYEWRLLDGVGHFPHREVADTMSGEIIRWAKGS